MQQNGRPRTSQIKRYLAAIVRGEWWFPDIEIFPGCGTRQPEVVVGWRHDNSFSISNLEIFDCSSIEILINLKINHALIVKMPTPGLLYVNSTIIKPEGLTPEGFTEWYQDEHIPDIFATGGIKEAFRYKSIDANATRPYLALYPLTSIEWLQSKEFKSIPVHSEKYLPKDADGNASCIFDYADFDTRYYELVAVDEGPGFNTTPATHLISVCSTESLNSSFSEDASFYRRRVYKLTFARQNRLPNEKKKLAEPPLHCTIYEFRGKPVTDDRKGWDGIDDGIELKEFELLKAFAAT